MTDTSPLMETSGTISLSRSIVSLGVLTVGWKSLTSIPMSLRVSASGLSYEKLSEPVADTVLVSSAYATGWTEMKQNNFKYLMGPNSIGPNAPFTHYREVI